MQGGHATRIGNAANITVPDVAGTPVSFDSTHLSMPKAMPAHPITTASKNCIDAALKSRSTYE
jgi:hypothetical protein